MFTKNIVTILEKQIQKAESSESASESTPASTPLAGTTGAGATSQSSLKVQSRGKSHCRSLSNFNLNGICLLWKQLNQLKGIAILEAQLALSRNGTTDDDDRHSINSKSTRSGRSRSRSKASSKRSITSSQSSKQSALMAALAHTRLNNIESSISFAIIQQHGIDKNECLTSTMYQGTQRSCWREISSFEPKKYMLCLVDEHMYSSTGGKKG